MTAPSTESRLPALLREVGAEAGFLSVVVSTEQGLPVAIAGDIDARPEALAALSSLFDDVVLRASRDVGFHGVDEVSLRDPTDGSLVVRPLGHAEGMRLFLVVRVPKGHTWRRHTNRLCRSISEVLALRR